MTTGPKMRIGEVHAILREEFPTIELSKIRYYEDKGLVRPGRSRKGYRLYSANDVACLREAFRLAQREFVPLRVVRQRLIEQGLLEDGPTAEPRQAAKEASSNIVSLAVHREEARAPSAVRAPVVVVVEDPASPSPAVVTVSAGAPSLNGHDAALDLATLAASSQLAPAVVGDLVHYGLLCPRVVGGRTVFTGADLAVATRARVLLERGVEPRHLLVLKRTVEREIALVDELTGPLRLSGDRGTTDAAAETRRVAEEVALLRAALAQRAARDEFGA